jgi:hypothetical protein
MDLCVSDDRLPSDSKKKSGFKGVGGRASGQARLVNLLSISVLVLFPLVLFFFVYSSAKINDTRVYARYLYIIPTKKVAEKWVEKLLSLAPCPIQTAIFPLSPLKVSL